MELKPTKGLKVLVNAKREAIFGDEAVDVRRISIPPDGARVGVLTGTTLAGYCEVEMPTLDGKRHWYPLADLTGEKGELIVEEEVPIEDVEDDGIEEE
jgi:hypothetical protein